MGDYKTHPSADQPKANSTTTMLKPLEHAAYAPTHPVLASASLVFISDKKDGDSAGNCETTEAGRGAGPGETFVARNPEEDPGTLHTMFYKAKYETDNLCVPHNLEGMQYATDSDNKEYLWLDGDKILATKDQSVLPII